MANYEERAKKFAHFLAKWFDGCKTLNDFSCAIDYYNATHSRKIKMAHGVSRIAIIRADYVIKIDFYDKEWEGRAGSNESEQIVYERAVEDGFAYLLAKTTLVNIMGREFSIMPRIDHIGDQSRWYEEFLTEDEISWLDNNVCDLHEWNLGYKNRKPVIIDYAWDATNW